MLHARAAQLLGVRKLPDGREREVGDDNFAAPPAKVERVYAAGPPASVLVFAIAPDKLNGWTRAMRPNEAQFFADKYAQLPELGRVILWEGAQPIRIALA